MWTARLRRPPHIPTAPPKAKPFFDYGLNVKTDRSDSYLDWNLLRSVRAFEEARFVHANRVVIIHLQRFPRFAVQTDLDNEVAREYLSTCRRIRLARRCVARLNCFTAHVFFDVGEH